MANPTPDPTDADLLAQREWPELRARVLDIAATLDRLDRAGAGEARAEAEALLAAMLAASSPDRAEVVLTRLSRGYDARWRERFAEGATNADPPTEEA